MSIKTKKILIISFFVGLIVITLIGTVVSAVKSYQYDMDPANGVDILEGLGAVFCLLVGGFVAFYELDLFYTVYYFFIMPKAAARSILNILSNLSLLLLFFSNHYKNIFKEDAIAPLIVFAVYIVFRTAYFIVSCLVLSKEYSCEK